MAQVVDPGRMSVEHSQDATTTSCAQSYVQNYDSKGVDLKLMPYKCWKGEIAHMP